MITWKIELFEINVIFVFLEKHLHLADKLIKFLHFHILKLLFPSIFSWYFRYFVSETYIFSGLKIHLHTINAVPFYYLWYTDKTLTLKKKSMNMRASGASELITFAHFHLLNCYFLQYFLGTSDTLSQNFQISNDISFLHTYTINIYPPVP